MSLLLHISDTHFGTEIPAVVDALKALVRDRHPDVLVFSGDITQRARPAQFAAARQFCDALGIAQQLVLPGNHDIPLFDPIARLTRPYANFLAAFGPRLEPVVDTGDFLVVGVNTTRAWRHKDGAVSMEQAERVARRLREATRARLRIVVTHQPAAVLRKRDTGDRLHNADPALRLWSLSGADLVLGGHIHLPYVLNLAAQGVPAGEAMWCVQAGTAVSSRIRRGTHNSVNLIHWRPAPAGAARVCRVERCDYQPDGDGFATAEMRELALA